MKNTKEALQFGADALQELLNTEIGRRREIDEEDQGAAEALKASDAKIERIAWRLKSVEACIENWE